MTTVGNSNFGNLKDENKAKLRIRYIAKDGSILPGVTTIVNQLNKPGLVIWAKECLLEGIDFEVISAGSARIGTLTHKLISDFIAGKETNTEEYTVSETKKSKNLFGLFRFWYEKNNPRPILHEIPLISETYRYGGTPDLYATIGDKKILIDFKTANTIHNEMRYQLAAYKQLLEENGYHVDECKIVRLNYDGNEIEERTLFDTNRAFQVFLKLVNLYYLIREERMQGFDGDSGIFLAGATFKY